jgi:hypothetical protein
MSQCLNPIATYFDRMIDLVEAGDYATIGDAVGSGSNPFLEISSENNGVYCCPDCSFYGITINIDLIKAVTEYSYPETLANCCFNYTTDVRQLTDVNTVLGNKPKICCNSFSECSSKLIALYQKYKDSPEGAVSANILYEFGTMNGDSYACVMVDYINSLTSDIYKTDILNVFNKDGFAVFCYNNTVMAGTLNGFKNWW